MHPCSGHAGGVKADLYHAFNQHLHHPTTFLEVTAIDQLIRLDRNAEWQPSRGG